MTPAQVNDLDLVQIRALNAHINRDEQEAGLRRQVESRAISVEAYHAALNMMDEAGD